MFVNRVYYLLKPIIPWGLRTALRRRRADVRRKTYASVWPIDPRAGVTPPNWPGWPQGKQFAFVLTHDVEGTKGLNRVEALMALEAKHGFRSSFNFVPEREYRLGDELCHKIEQAGFEVGVHGLKHDGKLYSSKAEFARRAARIREYMARWRACGFRSPLMQHKLQWLHLLGADYDASTFDTDPFEPEPDGAGTIFPFWVPGPNGAGFVELPYSLPQDFGMFTVLRERNIDIWKRKLDWVAERGGMVLLNTHPDYMCFGGRPDRDEFPIAFYEELLTYVSTKYPGQFWRALPREVSRYYKEALPVSLRNSRKKICMVAYTKYETDSRVRRYAEGLAKRGDHVEIIALATGGDALGQTDVNGVTLHRIQRREMNEQSKWTYALRMLRFLASATRYVARRHKEVKYDLVHVHNMPDFLVIAATFPKRAGAKLILDIHDVMPELFTNKFGGNHQSGFFKFLHWIERVSCAFSDHVIVANHLWYDKLIQRSAAPEKCSASINYVDHSIFFRRPRTRNDGKFVLLFPGTFQWHQGLDIAIEAMPYILEKLPNAELHLLGMGNVEADLRALARQRGLEQSVKFLPSVSLAGVAEAMANADIGVVPKRADSFGNEAYSTKTLEFMSQGTPAVISRTKIDSYYFDDSVVQFFTSGDPRALADAVIEVATNPRRRQELIENALRYAQENSWDRKKADYLALVDSLTTESFTDGARETGTALSARPPAEESEEAEASGQLVRKDS